MTNYLKNFINLIKFRNFFTLRTLNLQTEEVLKFEKELTVTEDVFGGVLIVIWGAKREIKVIIPVSETKIENREGIGSVT